MSNICFHFVGRITDKKFIKCLKCGEVGHYDEENKTVFFNKEGILMERIIMEKRQKHTEALSVDEPGSGNAHHLYKIREKGNFNNEFCTIPFQNGPLKEAGINGVFIEDLISIAIDRLKCFQTSEYRGRENAVAITKLEESLMWLSKRTLDRERRGVLGTHKV